MKVYTHKIILLHVFIILFYIKGGVMFVQEFLNLMMNNSCIMIGCVKCIIVDSLWGDETSP